MPKVAPFLRGRQPVENEYSHSDCDAYSRRADGHSQQGFTEKGCSRLGSDQFTRCGGRGDAAAGIFIGHPGTCAFGCTAKRLWLFLHTELSFGHRYGQLRPQRNDRDREISSEPQLYDAGTGQCGSVHNRGQHYFQFDLFK